MQEAVLYHQADVGIALDGDADRIVMIDEKGKILDGDQLLAVIAKAWLEKDTLRGNCVVGTSMTNLGFERFLDNLGLRLIRTPVGDRYVSEYMRTHQCNVGGEQSGHIILSDYARTGDGLVGALQILAVMVEKQKRTSEAPLEDPDVQKAIEAAIEKLGLDGSLVVRKSGTEPLIRLMAQGENEDFLHHIIDDIIFIMDRQGFIQK